MSQTLPEIDVSFVAGFGPISRDTESSTAFYVQTLGLPLKPMEGNTEYLLTEEGQLEGVKHFSHRRLHPVLEKNSGPRSIRYHRDGLSTR